MKSVQTIAREVIAGDWGSGDVRKNALEKAGYNYNTIQTEVTRMLNSRDATIENMEIWEEKLLLIIGIIIINGLQRNNLIYVQFVLV